jgi:hypothetical protein
MKQRIIFAAIVLLTITSAAFAANNFADLTSSYRVCPVRYVKAIYDAGPWSAFTIQKIGDRSSGLLWNWHSEDNSKEFIESVFSTKLAKGVDAAIIHDSWRGAEDHSFAMIDVSKGWNGIGVLAPIDGGKARLGPRVDLGGGFVGFATLGQELKPFYGLGYYKGKTSLDGTIGSSDSWWLRASCSITKGSKTYVPELRLRGAEGEAHIGFALGICY